MRCEIKQGCKVTVVAREVMETAMTTPENNDLIGYITKKNHLACAAHTLEEFFDSVYQMTI